MFVIVAEITTLFSNIWFMIFGLIAMIYNLIPLCMAMQKRGLTMGGVLAWVVAMCQIVFAAIIDEDNLLLLPTCDETLENNLEGTAFCDLKTSRIVNAVGGALWLIAGAGQISIPEPPYASSGVMPNVAGGKSSKAATATSPAGDKDWLDLKTTLYTWTCSRDENQCVKSTQVCERTATKKLDCTRVLYQSISKE